MGASESSQHVPNPLNQWKSRVKAELVNCSRAVSTNLWKLNALAISPISKTLFIASGSHIYYYDISNPYSIPHLSGRLKSPKTDDDDEINQIKTGFIAGVACLVAVYDSGLVLIWLLHNLSLKPMHFRNDESTWSLTMSKDYPFLLVGSNAFEVVAWNLMHKTPQFSRKKVFAHEHNIPCIDLSPDSRFLASISIDGTLRVSHIETQFETGRVALSQWGWACLWIPKNQILQYEEEDRIDWLLKLFPSDPKVMEPDSEIDLFHYAFLQKEAKNAQNPSNSQTVNAANQTLQRIEHVMEQIERIEEEGEMERIEEDGEMEFDDFEAIEEDEEMEFDEGDDIDDDEDDIGDDGDGGFDDDHLDQNGQNDDNFADNHHHGIHIEDLGDDQMELLLRLQGDHHLAVVAAPANHIRNRAVLELQQPRRQQRRLRIAPPQTAATTTTMMEDDSEEQSTNSVFASLATVHHRQHLLFPTQKPSSSSSSVDHDSSHDNAVGPHKVEPPEDLLLIGATFDEISLYDCHLKLLAKLSRPFENQGDVPQMLQQVERFSILQWIPEWSILVAANQGNSALILLTIRYNKKDCMYELNPELQLPQHFFPGPKLPMGGLACQRMEEPLPLLPNACPFYYRLYLHVGELVVYDVRLRLGQNGCEFTASSPEEGCSKPETSNHNF